MNSQATSSPLLSKKSISLKHAYMLIGLAGIVMLLLILNGYANGKRMNELTSPLLAAIRETRLEAETVQHESMEQLSSLSGNIIPDVWLYLDQSIWHLETLMQQNDAINKGHVIDQKMVELNETLSRIKTTFNGYSETGGYYYSAAALSDYGRKFESVYSLIDDIESEIRSVLLRERGLYRISHIMLALFCMTMTLIVGMMIHRYERHRAAGCEAVNRANRGLESQVVKRTRALTEKNEELQIEVEERRLAEQKLRNSRNMLQTVIDGMEDALMLVDGDMRIRMLNRVAAGSLSICCPEAAAGESCYGVSGKSEVCGGCRVPEAMETGRILSYVRKADGEIERLERVTAYPVVEKNGLAGHAIVRITDITEEKRFEEQLIKNEKMASLGVLVSSIAHEINNPNNFVSFNIPILKEYLQELLQLTDGFTESMPDLELFHMTYSEFRKDMLKLVDNIEHGAIRISAFVSNLREFSQGNGERRKTWIDLSLVSGKVLSICRSQIKKSIRDFRVDIPKDQPSIYTDGYTLEQILLNLIVNAVQASDKPDSFVSLSVRSGEEWHDHTIITVSDNGCGMDGKTMEKIFEPFFTTKPASEGTGLGLYVSRNLVRTLGGQIEVRSRLGEGTTFTVTIPDKDRRTQPRPVEICGSNPDSARIYNFYRHHENRPLAPVAPHIRINDSSLMVS